MSFPSPHSFDVLSFSWRFSLCWFAQVTISCHVRRPFSAVSLWVWGLVTVCAALVAEDTLSATPSPLHPQGPLGCWPMFSCVSLSLQAVRVTKPNIPETIRRNYELM